MGNKKAWADDFDSLEDFIELLNIPDNASGMFGRTAAATIIELEAERDALQAAKKACINIYMDLHVSEMEGKPEHLKQAWSVGQEFYLKKLEGEG